jgi:hypothetical protein
MTNNPDPLRISRSLNSFRISKMARPGAHSLELQLPLIRQMSRPQFTGGALLRV